MTRAQGRVERVWEHAGLACAVYASDMGHRCGYVLVPEGHPLHGKGYSDPLPWAKVDPEMPYDEIGIMNAFIYELGEREPCMAYILRVHGGVTFAQAAEFDGRSGWWVGFDCAHCDDAKDPALMSEFMKDFERRFPKGGGTIWTQAMVEGECEHLARQIAALASAGRVEGVQP